MTDQEFEVHRTKILNLLADIQIGKVSVSMVMEINEIIRELNIVINSYATESKSFEDVADQVERSQTIEICHQYYQIRDMITVPLYNDDLMNDID